MHWVDFGADTTTISVYKNNILRYLSVLPLGGNTITRDITSLQMEEQDAEKLKLQYGNASTRKRKRARHPPYVHWKTDAPLSWPR